MKIKIDPKWYIGIILLVIVIGFLIFIATPMQMSWGMNGAALTQVGLLLIAIAVPIIFKWKLSEILQIKKVTVKHFFGTLILYVASFILINLVTLIVAYLSPGMLEVGNALGNFFTTVPFIVAFLIVAVMPGICEEVLFRGVILHTMQNFKSELMVMLISAFIFGVFHLDFHRFFPTSILGFVMTYLMLKTGNLLLPVFFHFLNNAVSLSVSYGIFSGGGEIDTGAAVGIDMIGAYLIFATLAPALFFFAGRLLNPERKNKRDKFIIIGLSTLSFITGLIIVALTLDPSAYL